MIIDSVVYLLLFLFSGDMIVPSINRVDLGQIVERDSLNEQVIGGTKHFLQGLRVDGPMEVDYLDGVHLRNAHNSALFRDENATIYGNLVSLLTNVSHQILS